MGKEQKDSIPVLEKKSLPKTLIGKPKDEEGLRTFERAQTGKQDG